MDDNANPYASPMDPGPAEEGGFYVQPGASARFRSGQVFAFVTIALLSINGLLDLVAAGSWYMQLELLQQLQAGASVDQDELNANDDRVQFVAQVQLGEYWLTALAFLVWFHRAYSNLDALGAKGLSFSPGWAVGSWFVPILNLVRPCQVAQEIWRHSHPQHRHLPFYATSNSNLVGWWWALWIVGRIFNLASGRILDGATTYDEFVPASWACLANSLIGLVSAILAIAVVHKINRNQEERHRLIREKAMDDEFPVMGSAYS